MGKIKRYKNSVERFLSGESGQRFFNFAYSIGAAVVIWGALFKILHLPGGNLLLCIGMGTEVLMFILTAFDRPPREYRWEDVFPVLQSRNPEDRPDFGGSGGGVIINVSINTSAADATHDTRRNITGAHRDMEPMSAPTTQLNERTKVPLDTYRSITEHSDVLSTCSTGSAAQMEDLNRTIGGLNTIYEIQLKSVSSQLDSIDRVNRGIKDIRDMYERSSQQSARYYEETEKMARYMQQLNQVYEKMIHAMTVNMYRAPMPGAPADTVPSADSNPFPHN